MSFQYDTLDPNRQQIRLLSIHPSKNTSNAIHCSLHTVSLNDSPKFEALSYVWGTDDATEQIFLNGVTFHVTPNVAKALHQLRRRFGRRDIWVDAICINQCDIDEKNTQVPLMATIYSTAARVVVMLGDATPEIEMAVGWAERYVEKEFTKRALYWWWLDVASRFSHKARVKMIHADCVTLQGMIQIMTRPYWFRMWTYQEYLLPKSQPLTVCGNLSFRTSTILAELEKVSKWTSGVDRLRRDKNIPADEVESLKGLWSKAREEFRKACSDYEVSSIREGKVFEDPRTPGHHFKRTYHRKCQNPRDRIYGLYGVMPDLQKAFPPDYHKPFKQIALETTIWMIEQEGSMFLTLAPVAGPNAWDTRLPSWVQDYRPGPARFITSYRNILLAKPIRYVTPGPSEDGSEHTRTKVSDNGSILHLPAQRLGKCHAVLQFSTNPRTVRNQLIGVFRMIKKRWSDNHDRRNMQKHLIRTWGAFHNISQDHVDDGIHSLLEITELDPAVVTEGNMWEREVDTEPLIEQCRNIGGHRLFMVYLQFRYIFGITPGAVEDDDILTIPHLLNRAVILRIHDTVASKSDKPYYRVVGQAITGSYFRTASESLNRPSPEEFLVI
ncbi:heterokaryon incompatibility protein-domain-containing protein [Aspergillus welwitschiae]|uniref:Heterokaryon incompatibility protein-domain-containing protein n=1 Tax=Aspergillus welwitschiae TaxID=1341132 RepID=A0A3F3QC88_9EURO|nr:heterokaryon incompatibility protein-domain-containing protein [Aspergillus welwitschiae]RDH36396.1 heterokaryon incompatibility protein-domain-containing protein [Aspergillus welwitschiae]